MRASAEPRGHVERRTAEASVREPDGLARVDADADLDREVGVRFRRRLELALEVDGRAYRLARGLEDRQRLVATGQYEVAADLPAVELAAWTQVARAILNLPELVTRS